MRTSFSIVAFVVVVLFTMNVSADTQAEKYYQQAQNAYGQGKFEQAAKLLKKAYKKEANLVYIYNRVRALEGAKKYQQALKLLKKYEEPMRESNEFDDIQKLKRKYQQELKQKQKTKPKTENTGLRARKKIAFSLMGSGALMYGIAGFLGSYLPYKKKTRKKFGTGQGFTKDEVKTIKINKALTAGSLAAGTVVLGMGSLVLFNERQSNPTKVSFYGSFNELGLRLKF